MDYRIFDVRTFLLRAYTHGGWAQRRVSTTFWLGIFFIFFSCAPEGAGFEPSTLGFESNALSIEPPRHPMTCFLSALPFLIYTCMSPVLVVIAPFASLGLYLYVCSVRFACFGLYVCLQRVFSWWGSVLPALAVEGSLDLELAWLFLEGVRSKEFLRKVILLYMYLMYNVSIISLFYV